jgi:hypothetical protein
MARGHFIDVRRRPICANSLVRQANIYLFLLDEGGGARDREATPSFAKEYNPNVRPISHHPNIAERSLEFSNINVIRVE